MRQHVAVLYCLIMVSGAALLPALTPVFAQMQGITYSISQGAYQEVNGGDVLATGAAIESYNEAVQLPFTYTWSGEDYNQVHVLAGLGTVWIGQSAIYAWRTPLSGLVNGTLRVQTIGTTPNRSVVIQWRNATRAPQGSSQDQYNFQVRIHEGGSIDVVYGSMSVTAYMQPILGTSGVVGSAYLSASYWRSSWMMPTVSESELRSEVIAGWAPVAGTTYSYMGAAGVDASVASVSAPTGTFDAGQPVTVKAMIVNHGRTPLTTVQIAWSINGVAQPTVTYDANPALQRGQTAEVQLGTFTPAATSFNTLVLATTNPNGVADEVPGNDARLAYLAPRVEGMLNVIQNGAAGAFTSVSAGIRHLVNAGLKGDARLRIFGTEYNEQIIVPEMPASDFSIKLYAAEGYTPNFVFAPSNRPGFNVLDEIEQGLYQVYVVGENARVVVEDLRFTLPEDGLWGGHIYAHSAKALTIRNCAFTGVDDFANAVGDATALFVVRTPFTFHASEVHKADVAIMVDNVDQPIVIDSSTFHGIGSDAILASGPDLVIHANHVTADTTSDVFNGILAIGAGRVHANVITAHLEDVVGSTVLGIGLQSRNGLSGGVHGIDAYNNMVSVAGTQSVCGISVVPSAQSDHTRVVFNSVLVGGTAAADQSTALDVQSGPTLGDYTVVNNIFTNASQPGGFAVTNALDYLTISDYNNLMTTGPHIGRFNGADIARDATGHPLTSWRTATARDINSSSVSVDFTSSADLHLTKISADLLGASSGMSVTDVDIDGQQRIAPYMGADEATPVPTITKQPLSRYACIGEEMQFSIEATVVEGATVRYQWYRDGQPIVNATGPILQFTFVTYSVSGVYTCEVIATDGFHTERLMSEPASLIVVRPTEVIEHPVSQPAAPGATVSFDVIADAIGSPFTFSSRYQWKKRFWDPAAQAYVDTNVVDDDRISGATSSRLTIRDVQAVDTADTYVCEVIGYCGTINSKEARLFFPSVLLSLNTPRVCEGDSIAIECAVIPQLVQGSTVALAWFMNGSPLADDGRITGSSSKFLVIRNATQADRGQYHCVATYTGVGTSVSSDTIGVGIAELPRISVQPAGDTVCVGDSVRFEVQAEGNDLTYQWMVGATNIPGATSAQLTLTDLRTTYSGTYSVQVSNYCGVSTSQEFELLVIRAPKITTQPSDIAVFDGDVIRFTVETDGQEPLTYQWFRNDTLIDSANAATYEVTATVAATEAGDYYCVVSNLCGADTSNVVKASITVSVQESDVLAGGYLLGMPQPNPATDMLRITYAVPSATPVRITLVNALGMPVATLVDGVVEAGSHRTEIDLRSVQFAPGMYLVDFQSGSVRAARHVIVVR